MKFKIILAVIAILFLVGATIAYMQYNKPHRDAADEKPVAELTAYQLFAAFGNNEPETMALYGNKIIQVSGVIMETTTLPDGTVQAVLDVNDPIFGVKATFQSPGPENLVAGKDIILKGICSGFNSDVELTGCVIVQ
jgi:hypothetical protein